MYTMGTIIAIKLKSYCQENKPNDEIIPSGLSTCGLQVSLGSPFVVGAVFVTALLVGDVRVV